MGRILFDPRTFRGSNIVVQQAPAERRSALKEMWLSPQGIAAAAQLAGGLARMLPAFGKEGRPDVEGDALRDAAKVRFAMKNQGVEDFKEARDKAEQKSFEKFQHLTQEQIDAVAANAALTRRANEVLNSDPRFDETTSLKAAALDRQLADSDPRRLDGDSKRWERLNRPGSIPSLKAQSRGITALNEELDKSKAYAKDLSEVEEALERSQIEQAESKPDIRQWRELSKQLGDGEVGQSDYIKKASAADLQETFDRLVQGGSVALEAAGMGSSETGALREKLRAEISRKRRAEFGVMSLSELPEEAEIQAKLLAERKASDPFFGLAPSERVSKAMRLAHQATDQGRQDELRRIVMESTEPRNLFEQLFVPVSDMRKAALDDINKRFPKMPSEEDVRKADIAERKMSLAEAKGNAQIALLNQRAQKMKMDMEAAARRLHGWQRGKNPALDRVLDEIHRSQTNTRLSVEISNGVPRLESNLERLQKAYDASPSDELQSAIDKAKDDLKKSNEAVEKKMTQHTAKADRLRALAFKDLQKAIDGLSDLGAVDGQSIGGLVDVALGGLLETIFGRTD